MKNAYKWLAVLMFAFIVCNNTIMVNATESTEINILSSDIRITENDDLILNSLNSIEHDRTIDEIVQAAKEFPHCGFDRSKQTRYDVAPQITSPYSAGSLNSEDMNDAMNALKMVRFLAGLPYEDIYWDDYQTKTSQHKAVLMAVSEYGHHVPKPDDMSTDFYTIANSYSAECIYAGVSNISYSILGFVADPGANNIARAGHRMILFNAPAKEFGIGYAYNPSATWEDLIAVHVGYGWGRPNSYVAWPNSGAFPIQYFNASSNINAIPPYPWSITLGSEYSYPERDEIVLKLTRQRDGKVWTFDKNTAQLGNSNYSDYLMHLSVNDEDIIFRPDTQSLGSLKDGDKFRVELSGIKTSSGKATTLEYDINFFDLEKEKNRSSVTFKVQHNGNNVENAKVTIDGTSVYTDVNGEAVIRVNNNKKYTYSINKDDYNIVSDTISVGTSSIDKNIDLRIIERMLVNKDGELYQVASDREKLTIASVIDDVKVVAITADAFEKCDNLKELTLFENITSIEDDAFNDFEALKLYVKKDSYAHRFAVRKGINYEFITYMVGDVYTDGVVNSKDAIRLAQFIAKWKVELSGDEEKASDIVADGYINSKDIIKLNQYIAKWNVTLE